MCIRDRYKVSAARVNAARDARARTHTHTLVVSMITDPSAPLAVIVRMTKSPFFAVSTSPTLSPGAVVVWTILYFTPDSVDPSNPTVPGSALPSARAGAAVPLTLVRASSRRLESSQRRLRNLIGDQKKEFWL